MVEEFKCECGRVFKTAASRNSHYRFCNAHISINEYDKNGKRISKSKYKIDENLYRCECGKEFNNHQSLNAHFSHCDYHHECCGTIRKGHKSELTKSMCWDNKTEDEIKEFHKKSGLTQSKMMHEGLINFPFNGKANYNKNACKYIDDLNKKMNWNLQHAENGGEIKVSRYFLDGYDKNLNIAFEYDEPGHYVDIYNNILLDRDVERQNYIIEKLNCRFFRYNEKLDLLYEIIK